MNVSKSFLEKILDFDLIKYRAENRRFISLVTRPERHTLLSVSHLESHRIICTYINMC